MSSQNKVLCHEFHPQDGWTVDKEKKRKEMKENKKETKQFTTSQTKP